MAIEIFNRQELKFVITKQTYAAILPTLLQHMQLDTHNKNQKPYRLYNLYIDTSDRALIRHSMSKPVIYKEKLRIRSYTPFTPDSLVFFEVKKRYKKITNKRRTRINYAEALNFIRTGTPPPIQDYMNRQVLRELAITLADRAYQPTAYITYDRIVFFSLDPASDLRITFDANLTSKLHGHTATNQLLVKDSYIMEVKSTANMPLWLVQLLDTHGIYKQSFSKYGTEYLRSLKVGAEVQYA